MSIILTHLGKNERNFLPCDHITTLMNIILTQKDNDVDVVYIFYNVCDRLIILKLFNCNTHKQKCYSHTGREF